MFESEDFDLDEDFLKDIGNKEQEYYSQKAETKTGVDPPAKRRKSEPPESDPFGDITFDDEPDFAKTVPKPQSPPSELESSDVSLRQRRILQIFNTGSVSSKSENSMQANPQDSCLESKKKSPRSSPSVNENLEATCKNLALGIQRRGSQCSEKNVENLSPQRLNYPRQESLNFSAETGEIIQSLFKKPADRASPRKLAARSSPKFRTPPRMTLVRKFPGPAGLLPDSPESNLDHAIFLNGLDDREIDENLEDSKIADYCSQNTERLFSSGAWRSMIDDLPENFLKGHEIATIKRSALESAEKCKVPFVAGVVQRIDLSIDNPRLLLKDMTDSIEATMHCDVNLQYPNVLEPGVVVLLRGAGLLGYLGSQKCPGIQYHLMIAPRNLAAVYNEKACLVSSPWMETIRKKCTAADDAGGSGEFDGNDVNAASTEKQKISCERNPVLPEQMEVGDLENEDDDDLAFACFNLGEIKDSQTASSFSKTGPQTPGNFLFGRNREKAEEAKNSVSERPDVGEHRKKSPRDIARNTPRVNIEGSENPESEISPAARITIKPKPICAVRSRLLQFKSDDVSTPPVGGATDDAISSPNRVDPNEATEDDNNDGQPMLRTFGDDLLASDNDNDTEDELLSQLDVDAIMTNYSAST